MDLDHYFTIENIATVEFKDRGSKFIAIAFPISNAIGFKTSLLKIKDEHRKATHHCFAYRFGTDGNNFRSSDDGEPSGTAGKPILAQIDSKKLTNTSVVVVRYFGGTLLGVPGLINAYKTASALVLQTTPIVEKAIEIGYHLEFDYTEMNEIMLIVKKYDCSIQWQSADLFCQMRIGIPLRNHELILLKLRELSGVEIDKC